MKFVIYRAEAGRGERVACPALISRGINPGLRGVEETSQLLIYLYRSLNLRLGFVGCPVNASALARLY